MSLLPRDLHRWDVTPTEAVQIQRKLADQVIRTGAVGNARMVAGADLAFSADGQRCVAGVVVWDVQRQTVVEQTIAWQDVAFPYVPGLLSFREVPAILAAISKIQNQPDVLMCDGQGLAHPRRFGLACHLGVLLDKPTIGCAKSRLTGEHFEPKPQRGATEPLTDHGERIGTVLRTRQGVKGIYVSIGHRVQLRSAVALVLRCCTQYRLPEPTRLADKLVAKAKSQ